MPISVPLSVQSPEEDPPLRKHHRILEEELGGRLPETAEAFSRSGRALALCFQLTQPVRRAKSEEGILSGLRQAHGGWPSVTIEIRESNVLRVDEETVLTTYEEWQETSEEAIGRISTALLGSDSSRPMRMSTSMQAPYPVA